METTILREYKNDFNADLQLVKMLENPMPIATYEVERDNELHKGVVLVAILRNPTSIVLTEKHSSYGILSLEEINDIPDEECVPNFKVNAAMATQLINFE